MRLVYTILLSILWLSPTVARIAWQGEGCVWRNQTLIACYPRPDAIYTLDLGSYPGLDAAFRPQPFDVYTVVRKDGTQEYAALGAKPVYLPFIGR